MDIAIRKKELIEWLGRLQDEVLIQKIELLRKGSVENAYEKRVPKTMQDLQAKLARSEEDINAGKVYSQKDVESFFKSKFGN